MYQCFQQCFAVIHPGPQNPEIKLYIVVLPEPAVACVHDATFCPGRQAPTVAGNFGRIFGLLSSWLCEMGSWVEQSAAWQWICLGGDSLDVQSSLLIDEWCHCTSVSGADAGLDWDECDLVWNLYLIRDAQKDQNCQTGIQPWTEFYLRNGLRNYHGFQDTEISEWFLQLLDTDKSFFFFFKVWMQVRSGAEWRMDYFGEQISQNTCRECVWLDWVLPCKKTFLTLTCNIARFSCWMNVSECFYRDIICWFMFFFFRLFLSTEFSSFLFARGSVQKEFKSFYFRHRVIRWKLLKTTFFVMKFCKTPSRWSN